MLSNRLHIFPVIMAVYLPVAFIITYVMAVLYDHVEPVFPYISDTGTIPPESCVFGQLLNIYAVLAAWCMYLRYKQVGLYYSRIQTQETVQNPQRCRSVRRKQIANTVCLVIGIITALGISIVGNFQEDNILAVHILGATMAFGGAGVYSWIQAILSYKMTRLPKATVRCRLLRVILAVFHTVCFLVVIIATKLSVDKFQRPLHMIKKWNSSHPGYPEHLLATVAEWLMAIVTSTYFLTFMAELKVLRVETLVVPIDSSQGPNGDDAGADGHVESGNERAGSEETLSAENRY